MNQSRIVCALLASLLTLSVPAALGQYVWVDEKGVKQFSDMPPPAGTPKERILKSPAKPSLSTSSSSDEAKKPAPSPAAQSPMTAAERNAEYNRRRAERLEKEKKEAEQAKVAEEKRKVCEQAREYQRTLESGRKIVYEDKSGARQVLSEEQREKDMQDVKKRLAECGA